MGFHLIALLALAQLFGWGNAEPCSEVERTSALAMERIREEWPLRSSGDPVSRYVQQLGERLIRLTGATANAKWQFHVVRNLSPNAFAVGDGRFVVTDGLFALVRSDSELAAVIAHEIGHDLLGHFCRDGSTATEKFHVGSLVQHFDLSAEVDADAFAAGLLEKAGFSPGAMESVLHCLAVRTPAARRGPLESRIKHLARRGGGAAIGPVTESEAFLAAQREVGADLRGMSPDLNLPSEGPGCR
ncbi:MAG: M48 family metallopeptidase [Pseudomonadota bacterium]|nr:M48 family metallopeptidase [Pseudomonadota bacterium]